MSPPTAGCCAGRAMTGCTAAEDAAGATSAWPGMAYMGPGSACWCSGQSGAARAGAPCHATGYLHPRLPHVIFSLVDTQWVGCSRVLKPHPVLPPLNPLCISFVGTCFTAIVPSFSLAIAKANPPKPRGGPPDRGKQSSSEATIAKERLSPCGTPYGREHVVTVPLVAGSERRRPFAYAACCWVGVGHTASTNVCVT